MFETSTEVARERMIELQLVQRGITNPDVLDAMRAVPREKFVAAHLAEHAYEDRALASELGQTISQPYIVAFMTEALKLEHHHRVLEIGTGTGYQTAVLANLARHVHTIERFESLSRAAQERLATLGIANVTFMIGDGSLGWPEHAPFDRIIVTAGAPGMVQPLLDQLADPGRIVIPMGAPESQQLTAITRQDGRITETPLIPVRFVKLIGEAGFEA